MSQKNKFSQLAKLGKNEWWRYLLGFAIILISWLVIGSILHLTLQVYLTHKYTNLSVKEVLELIENTEVAKINEFFTQVPIGLQGLTLLSSFLFGLLAVLFVVKVIHKREIKTLFTNRSKFSYSRFLHGFVVFLLITVVVVLVSYFVSERPGIEVNFDPINLLMLLLVACLFLPIQVTFEELFFRSYLLQFLGLKIRNFWSLIITTGIIFVIPHLANPEIQAFGVWIILAAYLIPGLFFAGITLIDNRLELSLAAHLANNFFVVMFVSHEASILLGKPLLTITGSMQASIFDSIVTLVRFGLFCLYFFIIRKPKFIKPVKETNS